MADLYGTFHLPKAAGLDFPASGRAIRFHLIRAGNCQIEVDGFDPRRLTAGDLVLAPHGIRHNLDAAKTGQAAQTIEQFMSVQRRGGPPSNSSGCQLVSGFCHYDEHIDHPLVSKLPGLMVISGAQMRASASLAASLTLLITEIDLDSQGRNAILARLLEVIFIQIVRVAAMPEGTLAKGYMAAVADPQLSHALLAIHKRWREHWTLTSLARVAGMSRARFAFHFTQSVGLAPFSYLTQWRLIKARNLLRATRLDMEEVAHRCGYGSASALSRRFSAQFGLGPGAYRRRANSSAKEEPNHGV